ncbi:MAG: helix-turn-helix transcriptional regulator [Geminicoccaceae bacterium]|nr:helix-turn-helix transcriptional regulator [Geminicoccaceae bacterium]
MFTHAQMWSGIDRLARHHNLTPSGLARRAGLDPTTFNPSKRITKENKARWPSTESLMKILEATRTPLSEFVQMMGEAPSDPAARPAHRIPCIALDQADDGELFDGAGFPIGQHWDVVDFPNLDDAYAYALEVRGEALEPMFRDGDLLVVAPSADVRRHDRIVLRLKDGPLIVATLRRRTAQRIEIESFGHAPEVRSFAVRDVVWLARLVWASQ